MSRSSHAPRTSAFRPRLFLLALLLAIPWDAPLDAQVEVNWGTGAFGGYRRRLVDYMQQGQTIVDAIRLIDIRTKYCTAADRAAAGRALAAARESLDALRTDYTDWKYGINRAVQVPSTLRSFTEGGADPASPNFWTPADREIMGHAQADLNTAQRVFDKSTVDNCNPPRRTATAPPAPRAAPPRTNPLAGLTRPAVPARRPLPDRPPPFCSHTARIEWMKANLDPIMKEIQDASWALMLYTGNVHDALDKARTARDTAGVRIAQQEFDWAVKAHGEMDALYWEWARFRDSLSTIDCTPPRTATPLQPSGIDSAPPKPKADPRVGEGPRKQIKFGLDFEYTSYPEYEKVASDQPTSTAFDGKTSTTGYGASIGVDMKRFGCGLSGHWNTLTYDQSYASTAPNRPTRSTGSVDGQFYDLSCGPRFGAWKTGFTAFMGVTFAVNRFSFDDEFSSGLRIPGERELSGWKTNYGASFDLPIRDQFDLRFGLKYTTGGSGDADTNLRFGAGFQWRPGIDIRF